MKGKEKVKKEGRGNKGEGAEEGGLGNEQGGSQEKGKREGYR